MHNPTPILLLVLILALSTACEKGSDNTTPTSASTSHKTFNATDVEPDEASTLVSSGQVTVLDVRTPAEYQSGHIAGAVLADISAEGFDAKLAKLDPAKPIMVHCAAGSDGGRSRRALEALKRAGATQVYHLNGGFNAWSQAKHPVER
ncbi:MAG: rhodanese-like domain-containing protein [Myxococcota bacterium]